LLQCFGRTQPITIYPSNILHTPNQFTIGIPKSFGGDFGDDWGMVWGLHSIAPHPATVDFCCLRLQCSFGGLLPAVPTLQSEGFVGIFYNKHAEEPYALTSIFFFPIVGAKIGGTNLGYILSSHLVGFFFPTFFMAKSLGESSTDS